MATSRGLPVFTILPWVVFTVMLETPTPLPICCGLVPPTRSVGCEACERVWLSNSENPARLALNAVVFTLARLLPATSSIF
jgi:hypothetical protein